ncbi:MAG: histidine triad nucleotide-binding protein [Armatimonadota bacterium]
MPEDCLFCKIANQQIPVPLVYQDDELAAFRDINPAAPVHILIVPRRHIPGVPALTDADAGMVGKIFRVAAELARQEGIAESGFRVVVNSGPDAGQSVQHIHFHLLGGRPLAWPPG